MQNKQKWDFAFQIWNCGGTTQVGLEIRQLIQGRSHRPRTHLSHIVIVAVWG